MKRYFILLPSIFLIFTVSAQTKPPKWIGKVEKAVFKLETTTKEGVTKTASGFFVGDDGVAIAPYAPFRNAVKASVLTDDGRQFAVIKILGADEMYDVISFKVAVPKKTPFIEKVKKAPFTGNVAIIPPSKEQPTMSKGTIAEITKQSGIYSYYKIDMPLHVSCEGYPLLDEDGGVFAISQQDASGKGKTYGVSIDYILDIQLTATDLFKRTYSDIGIRKNWPTDVGEAHLALLISTSSQDAATYLETLNDFIATFPDDADGYLTRANHYISNNKELAASYGNDRYHYIDLAFADADKAAKITKKKGEKEYNTAKLIFGAITTDSTLNYKNFTLQTAADEVSKAIKENDLPEYHLLKGDIAFYNKDYNKAAEAYSVVNQTPLASGSSFYLAAKSKQQLNGVNPFEIVSLLDSAVSKAPAAEAAAYLLENIDLKTTMALYDQIIKDYDRYYLLVEGKVNDAFYYLREQAKFRSNDLEGALKDIDKAIMEADGKNAVYYAEKASVLLRLKDLPNAQEAASKSIALDPEFASAYRLLGIVLVRMDKKQDGCINLRKAKELGDTVAEKLIKENCN
ncbi:MAG: serine protease [Tannerella sp.]|jgi:Flp pilus assembly protein TadD|nr:serine protease [Tannerella sp.]